MASPFPGMEPYLEQSAFWSPFHNRLMVGLANSLSPMLRPQYYIEVETRSYMDTPEGELLVGIPDAVVLKNKKSIDEYAKYSFSEDAAMRTLPQTVTLPVPVDVKERYLEVREVGSNQVVTAIELLSPANKRKGRGREVYEKKRAAILSSTSHFVEIDLLRSESPFKIIGASQIGDYYVLVSRADRRPQAQFYSFTLRETLPEFLLPLKGIDEAIAVDLQGVFQEVYEQASYDLRIDYTQSVPTPALSKDDRTWAESLIESRFSA